MASIPRAPDHNRKSRDSPPRFKAFQRICFTKPGFRDQTRNNNKGDWYTNTELEWMLSAIYAKRMLFYERITSDQCSNTQCCDFNIEGQPLENAIIIMISYLACLERKKTTIPWNPEHFKEDPDVVAAHKILFKREMVYDIIRDHYAVTAQADPNSESRVHYMSRDAASRGFDEFIGGDVSVYRLYENE